MRLTCTFDESLLTRIGVQAPSRPGVSLRFTLVFAALLVLFSSPSHAGLSVTPLRAVLSEEQPAATFVLANTSGRLVEIEASLIDLAATPEGYGEISPEARAAISAAPWLAIQPARLLLEPGARADLTITLRGRVPVEERRSHLLVEAHPARTRLHRISDKGLGLDLQLAISVPLLVRPEPLSSTAPEVTIGKTSMVRLETDLLALNAEIAAPDSPVSLHGRLCLVPETRGGAAPDCIANIAVYRGQQRRPVTLELGRKTLAPGAYRLRYEGTEEFAGIRFADLPLRIDAPARE